MSNSADRLKKRRLKLGITMDDLAEQVGYTSASRRSIIYQIEAGKADLSLARIPSYASALNTNVYYLLGMTEIDDLTDQEILALIREKYGNNDTTADE